jgi:hypothetical protein
MKYFLFVIILIVRFSISITAQEMNNLDETAPSDSIIKDKKIRPLETGAYLNLTLGSGANLSLNIIGDEYIFVVRATAFFQDDGFIFPEVSNDLGILFGKVFERDEDIHIALLAGISITRTNERGAKRESSGWFSFNLGNDYERIHKNVVGIPIELQYSYHGKIVGIGATLFGNFNTEQPMIGFGVSFQFGKLY